MENKSVNVLNIPGMKKGVPQNKMKDTKISGEDKKVKSGLYTERLQKINDRIRSYRPITIKNYKPENSIEFEEQNRSLFDWDGETWDYGEYPEYLKSKGIILDSTSGPRNPECDAQLFEDFKILVKSSAILRRYNNPSKVRGGTFQDVDDFFNFVTIKVCERRLKQFDKDSVCRIWQNWPSYLARVLPQYLILYNKSKFDFEVEAYWPLVKNDKTGNYEPKDFGIDFELPKQLVSKEAFLSVLYKIISDIPEAEEFQVDILMYLIYGISPQHKRLVYHISKIVKMQMAESMEELL